MLTLYGFGVGSQFNRRGFGLKLDLVFVSLYPAGQKGRAQMPLCKLTRMKDSEQIYINPANVIALLPHEGGTRVLTNAGASDSFVHGINVMETPDMIAALIERL